MWRTMVMYHRMSLRQSFGVAGHCQADPHPENAGDLDAEIALRLCFEPLVPMKQCESTELDHNCPIIKLDFKMIYGSICQLYRQVL